MQVLISTVGHNFGGELRLGRSSLLIDRVKLVLVLSMASDMLPC